MVEQEPVTVLSAFSSPNAVQTEWSLAQAGVGWSRSVLVVDCSTDRRPHVGAQPITVHCARRRSHRRV